MEPRTVIKGADSINKKVSIADGLGLAETDIATIYNCAVHTVAMQDDRTPGTKGDKTYG